ncbi:MAG: serine/threonine protein kinase [Lachnospiraceae bacterium]|nr:serine/threonine protein kinase [Lachnospiraceae bacterium]
MFRPGEIVAGEYEIVRKIGEGGTSIVYLAMHRGNGKLWALKEIKKSVLSNQNIIFHDLVTREADLLTRLSHPTLPHIEKVLEGEDTWLLVMEFIEGMSLARFVERNHLAEEQAVRWMFQLADALQYLHTQNPPIIYRDMKPDNIMIRPNGDLVLIDFGTAREYKPYKNTGDTWALGTNGYAAPEQYSTTSQTDVRTDVYCLGATMHQVITGEDPMKHPFLFQPIRQFAPEYSPQLEAILMKCTQVSPDSRYQSIAELLADLRAAFPWIGQGRAVTKPVRRRPNYVVPLAIGGATLLLLIIVAAVLLVTLSGSGSRNVRSYQDYLALAKNTEDSMTALNYCKLAVLQQPGQYDAYDTILTVIEADNYLTCDEVDAVEAILDYSAGNMTCEEYFQNSDPEAHVNFCYYMMVGIFYYGEDMSQLHRFANAVMDSEASNWYDYVTAYQEELLVSWAEVSDTDDVNYSVIWGAFMDLWEMDPASNSYYYYEVLLACRAFLYEFLDHYTQYAYIGVTPDEMETALYQVESQVQRIENDEEIELDETDRDILAYIHTALEQAYTILDEAA